MIPTKKGGLKMEMIACGVVIGLIILVVFWFYSLPSETRLEGNIFLPFEGKECEGKILLSENVPPPRGIVISETPEGMKIEGNIIEGGSKVSIELNPPLTRQRVLRALGLNKD